MNKSKSRFPGIPDNYYFKIERGPLGIIGVSLYRIDKRITIIRKREIEKHVQIDWAWSDYSETDYGKANDVDGMFAELGSIIWKRHQNYLHAVSLIGTYPPKNL